MCHLVPFEEEAEIRWIKKNVCNLSWTDLRSPGPGTKPPEAVPTMRVLPRRGSGGRPPRRLSVDRSLSPPVLCKKPNPWNASGDGCHDCLQD